MVVNEPKLFPHKSLPDQISLIAGNHDYVSYARSQQWISHLGNQGTPPEFAQQLVTTLHTPGQTRREYNSCDGMTMAVIRCVFLRAQGLLQLCLFTDATPVREGLIDSEVP
jgi:hypothetical protein